MKKGLGCGCWGCLFPLLAFFVLCLVIGKWAENDTNRKMRAAEAKEKAFDEELKQMKERERLAFMPGKIVATREETVAGTSLEKAENYAQYYSSMLIGSFKSDLHKLVTHQGRDSAAEPERSMIRDLRESVSTNFLNSEPPSQANINNNHSQYVTEGIKNGSFFLLPRFTRLKIIQVFGNDEETSRQILQCADIDGKITNDLFLVRRFLEPSGP